MADSDKSATQTPVKPAPKPQVSDPFWNRKVFPDAVAALSFSSPSLDKLFTDALFVLDTNALLAPYQVSRQSGEEIDRIYRGLVKHKRLFVPEQAAREFARNRGLKVAEMHDQVARLTNSLPRVESLDCPMLDGIEAYGKLPGIAESINKLLKEYKQHVASLKQTLEEWGWNDPISALYATLFTKDCVIADDAKDADILAELEWRYAHAVPPGYKDKTKGDGGIGDFLIWKTILKLGRDRQKNVIFVCNELKHDWVDKVEKQALGPRMELSLEFHRESGHFFWLVNWPRFLELLDAKERTVNEAKSTERRDKGKDYALLPIAARIDELLDDIATILKVGPVDRGDGYSYILNNDIEPLVHQFFEAKTLYVDLAKNVSGVGYLHEIERILGEVTSLNRQLEYVAARMKRSGDPYTEELARKCEEFVELYGSYNRANIKMI